MRLDDDGREDCCSKDEYEKVWEVGEAGVGGGGFGSKLVDCRERSTGELSSDDSVEGSRSLVGVSSSASSSHDSATGLEGLDLGRDEV